MKKWLRSLFAIMLAIALTACGSSATDVVGAVVEVATDKEVIDAVGGAIEALTEVSESEVIEMSEPEEIQEQTPEESPEEDLLPEDGTYTTKEDVALYIYQYGHLPNNFITKKEAEKLGWEGGYLEPYAPGKCIGGNRFGNREGLLPEADGRTYTECDIDTLGAKKRGAKRIVFSNDGLIYYTEDHYESFELLYGEE